RQIVATANRRGSRFSHSIAQQSADSAFSLEPFARFTFEHAGHGDAASFSGDVREHVVGLVARAAAARAIREMVRREVMAVATDRARGLYAVDQDQLAHAPLE